VVVLNMSQKPKTPMPKKWIILLTVVIVAVVIAVVLLNYEPPDLTFTIDKLERSGEETVNLTLTYTTEDVNVTGTDYEVRLIARRTLETTEEKKTVGESPLPNIEPQSSASQSFSIEVGGFTDLTVELWKGNNRIGLRTQRLPIA